MACKCGSGTPCSCSFTGGLNVELIGSGADREPIQVAIEPVYLEGSSTASADAQVTGTGDVTDPYFLTIKLTETGSDKWGSWAGGQSTYDGLNKQPSRLYAITDPIPNIPGFENLFAGSTRLIRVYVGAVMVAEDDGGTLGPGTI